MSRFQSR